MLLPTRVLDLALLSPWFEEGTTPPAEAPSMVIPFLVIGGLFWLLLIAPERKRKKAREALLDALGKNDEVMTTGGFYGTVTKVEEQVVTLRIADGVHVRVARGSIQDKLNQEEAEA
ncbi:MAG: preprotein translocase subunit YajC [Planctomycetota bacterium]|jgi:preprotein translocase subunit YajC